MKKKVLAEKSLYYGDFSMPKGFEINRKSLKHNVFYSFLEEMTISDNPKDYAHKDYKLISNQPLIWLRDYLRDHIRVKYNLTLVERSQHANIFRPGEQSFLRNHVRDLDLRNSPDYTLIYVVDVAKDSCDLVIEYDNNKRKGNTWHMTLENNHFYMFPSDLKYFISENKSIKFNTIITINYEYI